MALRFLNSRYLSRLLSRRYAPRWLIVILDLSICLFSVLLAWLLRFNFSLPPGFYDSIIYSVVIVLFIRLVSFSIGRSYAGVIRYTSTEDAKRIFLTVLSGTLVLSIVNYSWLYYSETILLPSSVLIMDFVLTLLLMTAYRIAIKITYHHLFQPSKINQQRIAIYGAGRSGMITKRSLDQDGQINCKIVAFFDDDPGKTGKYLEGVPILPSDNLESALVENKIDELILSIQHISITNKESIVERCLTQRVKVKVVPPVNNWINGELDSRQIKELKIEDLMDRAPIQLGLEKINAHVNDRTVLVTGASGSIGRELVHQLASLQPEKIILLDIAESPLHELHLEMEDQGHTCSWETVIGDIRHRKSMEELMQRYRPDLIYHAAAYKHVPLMESSPAEAIMTNVHGTRVLAELARDYRVSKFVFVSSDKAVNPTNVMGASKRIAEIFVQSLNHALTVQGNGKSNTRFITTRFGNVLGSNGSVIPRFQKQIEKHGPVTITHPDISRYFMTIPEACQLIIEAGIMGKGGEIFIFDMGDSIKILDLAKKMIRLAGFEPEKDIKLKFTGLRPGEKIKEELLSKDENTVKTYHPKILIAKVREYSFTVVEKHIDELVNACQDEDKNSIVSRMKALVPEYKSSNSVYEQLDVDNDYTKNSKVK